MGGILPRNQEIIQRPGALANKKEKRTLRGATQRSYGKLGGQFPGFSHRSPARGCISRRCRSFSGVFLVVLGTPCLSPEAPCTVGGTALDNALGLSDRPKYRTI